MPVAHPAARSKRDARFDAVQSLFSADAVLYPVNKLAAELTERGGKAGLNALLTGLNDFIPAEVRVKNFSKSGSLQFDTPDGVLPLALLSNGYRQTAAWVSELIYQLTTAFGDYKAPLAACGLLLIDEIDVHLHPAWQRQIHAFLTKGLPNMQVIVTTYSPLTAQQAGRDELYALRRDEANKVTLVPFAGEPSALLLHQLLMSPIFGLETDESLKVETAKAEIRTAILSEKRGAGGESIQPVPTAGMMSGPAGGSGSEATPAGIVINTRSNSSTDAADLALLQQINAALQTSSAQTDQPLDV